MELEDGVMAQWEANDARRKITVELTVDGETLSRTFRAEEVDHIDWNPIINDMADSIAKAKERSKEPCPF